MDSKNTILNDRRACSVGRLYDLDWLRVLAVTTLVPFHTGMLFNTLSGWHIQSDVLSLPISLVNQFILMWLMPVLFFVTRAASWFVVGSQRVSDYIDKRGKRLLIPLAFGMLILVPPQVYIERIQRGQFQGSFLDFFPSFRGI